MTGHSEPLLQHRGVGCPLARQEETETGFDYNVLQEIHHAHLLADPRYYRKAVLKVSHLIQMIFWICSL